MSEELQGISYTDRGPAPDNGRFHQFDHVSFFVNNAKQAADWYAIRFGGKHVAYCGLETGERKVAAHVVKINNILLQFKSPLNPNDVEFGDELLHHGDGVKDVAFSVDNVHNIYQKAVERGAVSVKEPYELQDNRGKVILASIKTFGDTTHTFVDRSNWKPPGDEFLPGYQRPLFEDPFGK